MNMPDDLTAGGVGIDDHPEPIISKAKVMSDLSGNLVNMSDHFVVNSGQIENRTDMLAWDNQHMMRSLRGNILDDDKTIVRKNSFCGNFTPDNLAEQTFF